MTDLIPTRRGRMAGKGDWRAQYEALLCTPDQAAEPVSLATASTRSRSSSRMFG